MTAQVGKPQNVDIIHGLQRIIEKHKGQRLVACSPSHGKKVRESSDVRLRCGEHHQWIRSDILDEISNQWAGAPTSVVGVQLELNGLKGWMWIQPTEYICYKRLHGTETLLGYWSCPALVDTLRLAEIDRAPVSLFED